LHFGADVPFTNCSVVSAHSLRLDCLYRNLQFSGIVRSHEATVLCIGCN